MSTTIADLGERALIDRLARRITRLPPHVDIGIGDDAAALTTEPGNVSVVTTDAIVEGVHFDRRFTPPDAAQERYYAR